MKIQETAAVTRLFGFIGDKRPDRQAALRELSHAVVVPQEGTLYGPILQSKYLRPEKRSPNDTARVVAATRKTFAQGDVLLNAADIRVFTSCHGVMYVHTDLNLVNNVLVPGRDINVFDHTDIFISHTDGSPRNPGLFRGVILSAPSSKNATSLIIETHDDSPPTIEQGSSGGPIPPTPLEIPTMITNTGLNSRDRFIFTRVTPAIRPKGAIVVTVKNLYTQNAGDLVIPLHIPVVSK